MRSKSSLDYHKLVKADRVHGRLYTDPEVFADELEKIFGLGWVYVGHSAEVPEPGNFRLRRIGRQPVIMVRDQNGNVQLLLNRCRHRGATVCQEERGSVKAFRCAYHGWTYRLNGDLAGVPYPEAYDDSFHREEMGLTKVPRVDNYRGFIFGSLSPTGIALDEHLGNAKEQLDLFVALSDEDEVEVGYAANKYSFQANWKLGIENALDNYHVYVVHASYMGAVQEGILRSANSALAENAGLRGGGTLVDLGGGHALMNLELYHRETGVPLPKYVPLNADPLPLTVQASTPRGREHMAKLESLYGVERAKNLLRDGGTHALIFPNLVLIGVHMRVFQPISFDRTEVCLYPTTLKWLPSDVKDIRLRSHEAFFGPASFGGPDDSEIFERVMDGLRADIEPWVLFARYFNSEKLENGLKTGFITGETSQRAIWSHWKKVMTMRETPIARRQRVRHLRSAGANESAATTRIQARKS